MTAFSGWSRRPSSSPEPVSYTHLDVYKRQTKYSVPRMCFVNKMDRTGANCNNVLDDSHNKLGANAAAILIPIGAEDQLRGHIDVVNQKAVMYADNDRLGSTYTVEEIPAELKEEAELAYHELVSRVEMCIRDSA